MACHAVEQGPGSRTRLGDLTLFALLVESGDGCTYTSEVPLAVFDDESVAVLVKEELMRRSRQHISVRFIPYYRAISGSRVHGIANQLLAQLRVTP